MLIDDETFAPKNRARRRWIENIGILGLTVCLFLAASFFDFSGRLNQFLAGINSQQPIKMRAIDRDQPIIFPGAIVPMERASRLDANVLMSLGLVASFGLTMFAFVQYGRLRSALKSQQAAEKQSRKLAMHDQLTGLANRRNFEEFGQRVIFERPVSERRAVFLVDLDHFKPVNDVYGHAAGDKVLVEYAHRIERHFPGGIVARFGGDEFALITPPLKEDSEALHYARFCLAGAHEAFTYNGATLHVGASVGVAMIGDDGDTIAEALRRADIALYKAKRAGRQQIAFFEDTLEKIVKERSWMESELRIALKEGGIIPYFQPIVDLATRDVLGYEALARWNHRERGQISPAEFIPVAEECGLISQLGETILVKATNIARHWPQHIMLSVNLSPVQLRDKALSRKVLDILAVADFPASRLEVEVTENALISDLETARETIRHLRAAGVSVALDDFGTGHSTLNHLRVCRFDKIKIDQSFVQSLGDNRDSRLLVDAILNLSRSFGLRCTAEGIEKASDVELLSGWGCTEGQGYLFGKPAEKTSHDMDMPEESLRLTA
ncbi:MAG: diguanylate cyclase/phosphodiesterase [Rhizobium sp.]|nr:diguanylate cyclase/phosphodiesterase [Rhizobium sp.]